MNWYIKNEDRIFDLTDMNNFGFIYIIKLKDDKFYVGKKQIKNFTYKNINKYNSSNEYIKKHIDDIISKEIIEFTTDKLNTTYREVYHLIQNDLWLNEKSLNNNILGKFYSAKIKNIKK